MIEILCTEHGEQRTRVAVFDRANLESGWSIVNSITGSDPALIERQRHLLNDAEFIGSSDVHEKAKAHSRSGKSLMDARRRFVLECPRCGEKVYVREDKLAPILKTLDGHSVSSITLKALRSRLASS